MPEVEETGPYFTKVDQGSILKILRIKAYALILFDKILVVINRRLYSKLNITGANQLTNQF